MPTDGVEFVEEIDAAALRSFIECKTQLRGRLSHKPCDQRLQTDDEQRQPQGTGERFGGHGLPGSRRTDEQDPTARRLPVLAKPIPARLFSNQPVELTAQRDVQHDVIETVRGVAQFYEVGEVTAGRCERNSDGLPPTGRVTRLLHGLPKLFRQATMSLARLGRRDLERDGEKLLFITRGPAAQHGKYLLRTGHARPQTPCLRLFPDHRVPAAARGDNVRFPVIRRAGSTPIGALTL